MAGEKIMEYERMIAFLETECSSGIETKNQAVYIFKGRLSEKKIGVNKQQKEILRYYKIDKDPRWDTG